MYCIFFDLAYAKVEEMLVEETAKRLVLATCGGEKPRKVRAGEIIIPPPTPIIDPKRPATEPINTKKGKRKSSSKSNTCQLIYDGRKLINCLYGSMCKIKSINDTQFML